MNKTVVDKKFTDKLSFFFNNRKTSLFICKFFQRIECSHKPNGQWLKSIKFKLPIIEEDMEICLDNGTHVETVVSLVKSSE